MSEVTLLCNTYCQGTLAEHQVTFMIEGHEYSLYLCDECLEEFLDHGPMKGK